MHLKTCARGIFLGCMVGGEGRGRGGGEEEEEEVETRGWHRIRPSLDRSPT